MSQSLFDGPIATIFAVEVLEGTIIIGQYRTVLLRSAEWSSPERRAEGLRCINRSALWAGIGAIVVCAAIAVPLGLLHRTLDPRVGDIIEGVSKCVASFCILLLSLKIPTWLEVYPRMGKAKELGLTLKEIRFNVSWNIWREVAECGIFLIPFILGVGAQAIPISAVVGMAIGGLMGGLIYVGNKRLKNKKWLTVFMCLLLVFVSAGLITGGVHEFEEVWGETHRVWEAQNAFWSSKNLPMILLKPFGYSSPRTVLQMVVFWSWLILASLLHCWKYRKAKAAKLRMSREVVDTSESSESAEVSRSNSISRSNSESVVNADMGGPEEVYSAMESGKVSRLDCD